MEQREFERHNFRHGVVVSCPQFGLFRGKAENLSTKGIFVRTQSVHMCLNAPVTVTFQPNYHSGECLNIEGVVVQQSRDGFGIEFSDLSHECQKGITRLLEHSAATNRLAS